MLGLAVVMLAPSVRGQDPETLLSEAQQLYRRGQFDSGLAKLNALLGSDPSTSQAAALRDAVEFREWALIMSRGPEHETAVKALFDRALPADRERENDAEAIRALIAQIEKPASEDRGEARVRALLRLGVVHGEYAVPYLVSRFGSDSSDRRANAIDAAYRLGDQAVLPLIQALESGDMKVRMGAASALGLIGNAQAVPYLTWIAMGDDAAAAIAKDSLRRMGHDGMGDAVAQLIDLAGRYAKSDSAIIRPFRRNFVVWAFVDGQLVAREVPREIYGLKLAEEAYYDALAGDAANADALTGLARVLLAQVVAAEGLEEGGSGSALAHASEVASALGAQVLGMAVEAATAEGDGAVAAAGTRLLAALQGEIEVMAGGPLSDGLEKSDKMVRYQAALSMAEATNSRTSEDTGKMVQVLAEALGEDVVRTAVVIDDQDDSRNAIVGALNERGWYATGVVDRDHGKTGGKGLGVVKSFPIEDLVIVRYNLADESVASVIKLLKSDARTADTPIAVIADHDDLPAAQEAFGTDVAVFISSPPVADAYEPELEAAVTVSDEHRQEGVKVASAAAAALAKLEPAAVAPVVPALIGTLQGSDEVRIPAMAALGAVADPSAGTALLRVLRDGTASEDARGAAAIALARISAAAGMMDATFTEALEAAIQGEGGKAFYDALGTAVGIAPYSTADRVRLARALRARITVDNDEG